MTVKYTPELLEHLISQYRAKPCLETVDELASQTKLARRSIISKLSALGIYQKKSYLSKTGDPPVKKEYYVEEISELLDISPLLLESLEKSTKMSLRLIVEGINKLKTELK